MKMNKIVYIITTTGSSICDSMENSLWSCIEDSISDHLSRVLIQTRVNLPVGNLVDISIDISIWESCREGIHGLNNQYRLNKNE